MLDNLCGEVAEDLLLLLELEVAVLHFNPLIAHGLPLAVERQAALAGLVRLLRLADDRRIQHRQIGVSHADGDDALALADHVRCQPHTAVGIRLERIDEIRGNRHIPALRQSRWLRKEKCIAYNITYHDEIPFLFFTCSIRAAASSNACGR